MVKPAIIKGQSAESYHDSEGVNKSLLDIVRQSPAHARYYLDNRNTDDGDTKALLFGRALHNMVLEPHNFDNNFCVAPNVDRRTKAGKEEYEIFQEVNAGKYVLSLDAYETVLNIRNEIYRQPNVENLLTTDGDAEVSVYWTDDQTGMLCRCRPDFLRSDGIIVDLKTTEDASPEGFAKSIAKYRYHVQAAWYMRGVEIATGERPQAFVFIAVEKKAPYAVGIYVLDERSLDEGECEMMDDLNTLAECIRVGQWPSYGRGEICTLSLPPYYKAKKTVSPEVVEYEEEEECL